ncbi:MAG TPA: O-methyltransferase [Acidimicrobiales bacterium]|nr:O-methyltransferase [Acidimicrobiales bacterium]
MPVELPPGIEDYVEAHTSPPASHLNELARETADVLGRASGMLVGALEGRFLEFLVFALQPRVVLEVGTFTGYSSIAMAAALPPEGRIITCEISEQHAEIARRHIARAGLEDVISVRLGSATETLAELDERIDFAFIDADKTNYLSYYEAILPKLATTGIIAVDNTLWSGRVADLTAGDADTVALKAFNAHVVKDERVVCAMLPVRDGVTLIRRS